jgi:hypothetical protein
MELIREFYLFMKVRKKYWLLPVLVFLALLAFLLIFAQTSPVAPFVYTVF